MRTVQIVMYHYVRPIKDSLFPEIKGLEIEGFRNQLDFFQENFSIITADSLISAVQNNDSLPRDALLLTFDDGYKDHFQYVFPELSKRNLQGLFFPPARPILESKLLDVNAIHYILASAKNIEELLQDFNSQCLLHGIAQSDLDKSWKELAYPKKDIAEVVFIKSMLQRELPEEIRENIVGILFEKYVECSESELAQDIYMSVDELKELIAQGMYVGSHAYNHFWLDSVSYDLQKKEIEKSLHFLEGIGAPTNDWIMCYPYGAHNEETIQIIKEKGCALALGTEVGATNLDLQNRYSLKRWDTNDFPQ
jgi:peptidoglycan/xylan/chitin deacetylase (PgdA/CDA1 family)